MKTKSKWIQFETVNDKLTVFIDRTKVEGIAESPHKGVDICMSSGHIITVASSIHEVLTRIEDKS